MKGALLPVGARAGAALAEAHPPGKGVALERPALVFAGHAPPAAEAADLDAVAVGHLKVGREVDVEDVRGVVTVDTLC